jgi:hypothetical protein
MIVVLYMLAFMLIPIWIPVIAVVAGFLHDRIRPNAEPGLDIEHLRSFK